MMYRAHFPVPCSLLQGVRWAGVVMLVAALGGGVWAAQTSGQDQQTLCPTPVPKCDTYESLASSRITDDKIIGGQVAEPGTTPWMVSLQDTQYSTPFHFCVGTLLSHTWVITSASCVESYQHSFTNIRVVMGEYDLTYDDGTEQERHVIGLHLHDYYDPYTLHCDVALLRLSHIVIYSCMVAPLALPCMAKSTGSCGCGDLDNSDLDDENDYLIAGWGRTAETSEFSQVVMWANVPLLPREKCHQAYPNLLTSSMMCAGNVTHGGVDPCQGDWGGALVSHENYIRGVASWSDGCGRPGYPAIFTDIFFVMDWVCHVINPSNDPLGGGGRPGVGARPGIGNRPCAVASLP